MPSVKKPRISIGPALVTVAAAGLLAGGIWYAGMTSGAQAVEVKMPKLSALAEAGQRSFAKNCAQCHGDQAGGTDQGPPLIHRLYQPNHHGDGSFQRAVAAGTPQHHWRFGSMPPQPQIKQMEIQAIVKFVREVQRSNGIN